MAEDIVRAGQDNGEVVRELRVSDFADLSGSVESPRVYPIEYIDQDGSPVPGPSPTFASAAPKPRQAAPRPPAEGVTVHVHNHTYAPAPETSDVAEPQLYEIESGEAEPPRRRLKRIAGIFGALALVGGLGYAAAETLLGTSGNKHAEASAVPVPGDVEATTSTPQATTPTTLPTGLGLNPVPGTHSTTAKPKPTTTASATRTETASPTHTVKEAPAPTTKTVPAPTTATPTETETTPPVSYELPSTLADVISSSANQDTLHALEGSNPQLKNFMDKQNLARTANLSAISSESLDAYRAETSQLYAQYGARLGGVPKYYSEASLTDRSQVAQAMVAQTDRILTFAGYTYADDPQLSVVDLAYWPRNLQNDARKTIQKNLNQGNDPSHTGYSEAIDATVLDTATYQLKDGSNVDVIATWSDYGQDQNGDAVQKVRWELPVKIDDSNDYVNVTLAEMDVTPAGDGNNWNPFEGGSPTPPHPRGKIHGHS